MDVYLTHHAVARAQEMAAPIAAVEAIVQAPSVTRPSRNKAGRPATLAVSDAHPHWAVLYVVENEAAIVLSVVFRTMEAYVRTGATFRALPGRTA